MKTEHIKSIFENYLLENKTQYAILINGNWGSGKTFYWKNELTQIAKSHNYKTIYISLNGVNSIKSLKESLFFKLIPIIGKDDKIYLKNIFTIVSNSANAIAKYFLKSNFNDIFKGVGLETFSFDNYIICFDDLERCQIPIKETLGFINTYTEHKHLKTIILADEKKIESSQKDYDNIKEKVIGRVINYYPDLTSILININNSYKAKNDEFYSLLNKNKEFILTLLIDYNVNNIRIIKFYYKILEKIFPYIKEKAQNFIEEILLFSLIISIEFKIGNLTSNDFNDKKDIDFFNNHIPYYWKISENGLMEFDKNEEIEINKEDSYQEKFYKKYLTKWLNKFYFYDSIYKYILTGYLDIATLKEELSLKIPIKKTKEILDFEKIINNNYRNLEDQEFEEVAKRVLKYAEQGKYNMYDYVKIANFYLYFIKNNIISLEVNKLNELLCSGIELAKDHTEISDNKYSSIYHLSERKDLKKIVDKIKENHLKKEESNNKKIANKLLDIINKNEHELLKDFFKKIEHKIDLFKYIDSNQFCETLIHSNNLFISEFIAIFSNSYSPIPKGNFVYNDYDNLTKIVKCLKLKNEEIGKLKGYLINELIGVFDKKIKIIENVLDKHK